jgi:hypothetical protein
MEGSREPQARQACAKPPNGRRPDAQRSGDRALGVCHKAGLAEFTPNCGWEAHLGGADAANGRAGDHGSRDDGSGDAAIGPGDHGSGNEARPALVALAAAAHVEERARAGTWEGGVGRDAPRLERRAEGAAGQAQDCGCRGGRGGGGEEGREGWLQGRQGRRRLLAPVLGLRAPCSLCARAWWSETHRKALIPASHPSERWWRPSSCCRAESGRAGAGIGERAETGFEAPGISLKPKV